MPDDNIIAFKPRPPSEKERGTPPPMFNIPPATKNLAGLLIVIHIIIAALTLSLIPNFDAVVALYGGFTSASWTGGYPFLWWTPLTLASFAFIHGGWLHLGVNILMLVSIGSGVEKTIGAKKFLWIYALSTLTAVLTHFAFNPFSTMPIVGASGGISGIFGAMLYMMRPQNNAPHGNTSNNSVLPVALVWIAVTVVVGIIGAPNGAPVAWVAHIGGFIGGIAIMRVFSKGRA
jgi:membrane associated rhomboid family serine protease